MARIPNEPQDPAPPDAKPPRMRVIESTPVRYDTATEARLCSSLMADVTTWSAVEGLVRAEHFWDAALGHVFSAIEALHGQGTNPWPPQVVDELRRAQLLEVVGGAGAVETLADSYEPGSRQRSADDARLIAHYARSRRFLAVAEDLKAVAARADHDGALEVLQRATEQLAPESDIGSSWMEVDIGALLEAGLERIKPTMLARDDDECLIYPGKTHAFNAEPEAGKSFLACWLCAERIAAGEHALYIDFEDDANEVIGRMMAMGVSRADVTERFHYVRPDEAFDLVSRSRILDLINRFNLSIAVLDGLAEAMVMNGWDENLNSDIAKFLNALPRFLERHGIAVVMIDHLVKDKAQQGRYARGGAHKLAGISGAAYKLEVVSSLAVGKVGKVKLSVVKDRPGWVRRCAVGSRSGFVEIASNHDGSHVAIVIEAPKAVEAGGEFLPTSYMEKVSRWLENVEEPQSKRAIRDAIEGDNKWIDLAITKLLEHGYIVNEGTGSRSAFRSIETYTFASENTANRSAPADEIAERRDLD